MINQTDKYLFFSLFQIFVKVKFGSFIELSYLCIDPHEFQSCAQPMKAQRRMKAKTSGCRNRIEKSIIVLRCRQAQTPVGQKGS